MNTSINPDLCELYRLLINQLQHEDQLTNMRLQWALIIDGLLATAMSTLLTAGSDQHHCLEATLLLALSVLFAAGISVWSVILTSLHASQKQQFKLCEWWEQVCRANTEKQSESSDYGVVTDPTLFPPFYKHSRVTKPYGHISNQWFVTAVFIPIPALFTVGCVKWANSLLPCLPLSGR